MGSRAPMSQGEGGNSAKDLQSTGVRSSTGGRMRGGSKGIFIALLGIVVFVVYLLILTHHLKIDFVINTHGGGKHGKDARLQPAQLVAPTDFFKYDLDKDGKLSWDEFKVLLAQHYGTGGKLAKWMALDRSSAAARAAGDLEAGRTKVGSEAAQASTFIDPDAEKLRQIIEASGQSGEQQRAEDRAKKEEAARKKQEAKAAAKAAAAKKKEEQKVRAAAAAEAAKRKEEEAARLKSEEGKQAAPAAGGSADGCAALSQELVASFARDNTIMLTVADWRVFETFGINWMKTMKDVGVDYYVVGATDQATVDFLGHQGARHPCFSFLEEGADRLMVKNYRYGDDHYRAATWRKVVVVSQIVDWGFNVLHADVDTFWFRDPLPYFLGPAVAAADIVISTDLISTQNPKRDDGLEKGLHQHVNFNTGVYFVKSTPGGKKYMREWAELRKTMAHDNDQVGMYRLVRNRQADMDYDKRVMALHFEDPAAPRVRVGMLPVHMLLNGYSYYVPQLNVNQNVSALGVHFTWVPLSVEGKLQRMKDGMFWHDPPEYYDGPNLLAADIDYPTDIPPDFNAWKDTEAMIKFHLKKMEEQLVQVYRIFAIAVITNRTMVLPRLRCYCYKNWFMMEQCRIPGDHITQFPLECMLDQWLRPKLMHTFAQSEGVGGQPFRFREHTFFDNPAFPQAMRQSEVVVEPGPTDCPTCVKEGSTTSRKDGKIPAGQERKLVTVAPQLKQKALAEVLGKLSNVRVLRLRHAMELFGGWEDEALKASFEKFLDKVTGNWCCRDKPFIAKGMKEKEKLAIHW